MNGPEPVTPPPSSPVFLRSGVFFNDPNVDPDLATLTDYLAGELDVDAAIALEERLDNDRAFAEMASPLIALWRTAQVEARRRRARGLRRWSYAALAIVIAASALAVKLTPNTSQDAAVVSMWRPITYAAGDSVRAVIVSGGVLVTLAPHASVTVDRLRFGDMAVDIALAGNAWIDVPPRTSATVRTAVGRVEIGPGRFVVTDSVAAGSPRDIHISREESR